MALGTWSEFGVISASHFDINEPHERHNDDLVLADMPPRHSMSASKGGSRTRILHHWRHQTETNQPRSFKFRGQLPKPLSFLSSRNKRSHTNTKKSITVMESHNLFVMSLTNFITHFEAVMHRCCLPCRYKTWPSSRSLAYTNLNIHSKKTPKLHTVSASSIHSYLIGSNRKVCTKPKLQLTSSYDSNIQKLP